MKFYKRKILVCFIATLSLFLSVFAVACKSDNSDDDNSQGDNKECSVSFLDVGNSDSIFINLPDGKCMLIDCGDKGDQTAKNIEKHIKSYGKTRIDYLVITHPDVDHVGNAKYLIEAFDIDVAYLPNIPTLYMFSEILSVKDELIDRGVLVKHNLICDTIIGRDYSFIFLSPEDMSDTSGIYKDFHLTNPTATQINDISAVIYFECDGVRFLFTGDASANVERRIADKIDMNFYNRCFSERNLSVNLNDIDFLKVAHHGSEDASCSEFLSVLRPKNAVISVGADNVYGHPSSSTLERLLLSNADCNVLRTDTLGNITVKISKNDYTVSNVK